MKIRAYIIIECKATNSQRHIATQRSNTMYKIEVMMIMIMVMMIMIMIMNFLPCAPPLWFGPLLLLGELDF